jgi:hypothetical protein
LQSHSRRSLPRPGPRGSYGKWALIAALVVVIVGVVLYRLGQAFERLLDDGPEDDG